MDFKLLSSILFFSLPVIVFLHEARKCKDRKSLIRLVLGAIALFLFVAGVIVTLLWLGFSCEKGIMETVQGPDNYVAQSTMDECDGTIQIFIQNKDASIKQEIFRYDPVASDPKMKWIDQDNLEISIDDTTHIDLQVIKFGHVAITYHIARISPP